MSIVDPLVSRCLDVINCEPREPDSFIHSVFANIGEIEFIVRWSSAAQKHHAFVGFTRRSAVEAAANMKLLPAMVTRGWRLSRLNPDLRDRVASLLPPGIDIGPGGRSGDRPSSPRLPPTEHSANVPDPNGATSPPHQIPNSGGVWGSYSPSWDAPGGEAPNGTKGNVDLNWKSTNDSWRSNWDYSSSSYRPPPPARNGDFDPYDLVSNGPQTSPSAALDSTSKNSPPNHRAPLPIDRPRSRFGPPRSPSPTWLTGSRRYPSPPPRSPPSASYRSSFILPSKPTFSPELRDEGPRFPEKIKPMTFPSEPDRWVPYKRRYPSPNSRWGDRKGRSRSRSRERMNGQRFARDGRADDASARYRNRPRHHSRSRSRSRSTSRGRTQSPPNSRRGNGSSSSLRDTTTDSNDPKRPIAPRPSRPSPPPRLSIAERVKKVTPSTSTVTSAQTNGSGNNVSETTKESNAAALADTTTQPSRLPVTGDTLPDKVLALPPKPDELIRELIRDNKPTSEWLVLAAEYARRDDLNNADWVAMSGVEEFAKRPPPDPTSTKPLLLFLANTQTTRAKRAHSNLAVANACMSKAAEWIQKAQALGVTVDEDGTTKDSNDGLEWLKKHMVSSVSSSHTQAQSLPVDDSPASAPASAPAPTSVLAGAPSTRSDEPAISASHTEVADQLSVKLAEAQSAHQHALSQLKAEQSARVRLQERIASLEELLRVAEAKAAAVEVAEVQKVPADADADLDIVRRAEREKSHLLAIISEERLAKRRAEDAEQEERNVRRKLEDQLWVLGGTTVI